MVRTTFSAKRLHNGARKHKQRSRRTQDTTSSHKHERRRRGTQARQKQTQATQANADARGKPVQQEQHQRQSCRPLRPGSTQFRMPKAPKDERELPLGDQTTWVAKRLWRERRYGPGGVLRCDVVLVKRRPDRKEQVNPNLDLNPWCCIWLAFSEKRAARCNKQAKDKHCSALLQDEEVALFASSQKGGRHWLKVKAAGKNWYWHRLVAWCFSNPRNLTWATYHKKDRQGA